MKDLVHTADYTWCLTTSGVSDLDIPCMPLHSAKRNRSETAISKLKQKDIDPSPET